MQTMKLPNECIQIEENKVENEREKERKTSTKLESEQDVWKSSNNPSGYIIILESHAHMHSLKVKM